MLKKLKNIYTLNINLRSGRSQRRIPSPQDFKRKLLDRKLGSRTPHVGNLTYKNKLLH